MCGRGPHVSIPLPQKHHLKTLVFLTGGEDSHLSCPCFGLCFLGVLAQFTSGSLSSAQADAEAEYKTFLTLTANPWLTEIPENKRTSVFTFKDRNTFQTWC